MESKEAPLDEIVWSSPMIAAQMMGIHENSVLHYFAQSPFYDSTSNNAVISAQAQYNEQLGNIISTRAAFEAHLRTMAGLEFMISEAPAEMTPGAGTGVWVIRKQTRRKRPGEEDEIIVHGTYFVVGDNVYQAPSLGNVIGARMLSVLSSLNNFISSAGALPQFSPALGHVYMQPTSQRLKPTESQFSQASKENTPLPDSLQNKKALPSSTNNSTFMNNQILNETISLSTRYGDEYMDEIPITGQPGEFHLSSTGRKEKDKLMVPATTAAIKTPLQPPAKAPPPTIPALKTDIPPEKKGKGEKSPKTPGTAKLKRRKSKALGTNSAANSPK